MLSPYEAHPLNTAHRNARQSTVGGMVYVYDDLAAALEALAGAIPAQDYATALTLARGRAGRLTVADRNIPGMDVDVYAEAGWFVWAWGERIARVTDPATAAAAVAGLLRPAPVCGRG